jgi:hypothetical protein
MNKYYHFTSSIKALLALGIFGVLMGNRYGLLAFRDKFVTPLEGFLTYPQE